MRATGPAARAPDSFLQLGADPFDVLAPCLIFLDGDGPADPLVPRERSDVFPCRPRLRIGSERVAKIRGKIMDDSFGDANSCHSIILLA